MWDESPTFATISPCDRSVSGTTAAGLLHCLVFLKEVEIIILLFTIRNIERCVGSDDTSDTVLRFGDGNTLLVFWFPASRSRAFYWRRIPRRKTDFCPRVEGKTSLYLDKEVKFYLIICIQVCHFEAEKIACWSSYIWILNQCCGIMCYRGSHMPNSFVQFRLVCQQTWCTMLWGAVIFKYISYMEGSRLNRYVCTFSERSDSQLCAY